LHFPAVDFDLVVVSAVHGGSVDLALGEGVKDVVVEPLFEGSVFSGVLHDLLSNNATKEGSHWRDA